MGPLHGALSDGIGHAWLIVAQMRVQAGGIAAAA